MDDSILTIQQVQFFDKYSRYDHAAQKHETFGASCDRSVDFFADIFKKEMRHNNVFPMLRESMLSMDAFPGMRLFQNAGASALRDPESIFNCSYIPVCDLHAFRETMRLLGLGVGVGYSVEQQYVSRLPMLAGSRDQGYAKTIVVEDSLYGWTNALYEYLKALFANQKVDVDYSYVRPAGAPLHTRGGFASGPEPLRECFENIRRIIESRRSERFLRTIDAHDIQCCIASAIVSGGVRRAAMISLFSENDNLMWNAKSGNWYEKHLYRRFANNSVVITGQWQKSQFDRYFDTMVDSRSGEPGIFSRYAANITKPARRAYAEFGTNPCIVGSSLIATADGRNAVTIKQLADEGKDVPVYAMDVETGKIQIKMGRNPRLTKKAVDVVEVQFQDDTSIRVTPDHKILVIGNDGSRRYVEASKLKPDDRIASFNAYESNGYRQIANSGTTKKHYSRRQYRLIYEYYNGPIGDDQHIHHIDFTRNDNIENLRSMPATEHMEYHAQLMSGENNPFVRAKNGEFGKKMFEEWRNRLSIAGSGENNPRWSGVSNEDLMNYIVTMCYELGFVPMASQLGKLLVAGGYPMLTSDYRINYFGGVISEFLGELSEILQLPLGTKSRAHSLMVKSIVDGNHKVRLVVPLEETMDVYNITVDDHHNYVILTSHEGMVSSGVVVKNCGEVALNPWQFCNLSIANVRYTDSTADLKEKVRLAAIWGTMQAAYLTKVNHTPQLRPQWYINQVNERLLGVDLNGLRDNPMLNEMFERRDGTLLNELKMVVLETNQEFAKLLGIAPAAAATCDKPAGNSATLFNTASGMGPRYAPYYTRRMRLSSTGRVAKLLALHGMPFNPEVGQDLATANTLVFDFPVKAPDGAVYASDLSGIDQLEFWRWCKTEWTEHNPSTTVYFNPDEVDAMSDWAYDNQNLLGGVSFLPRDNTVYALSPYEVITPEKYEEDAAKLPYIDWTLLDTIGGDISTSAQEFACVGGACEVV